MTTKAMSTETSTTLDPRALRNALGSFATGITVITAQSASGEKVGVTANSFNSLSMDPPLILWSLDKRAGSYEIFSQASHFAVNILSADQMETSNHFATKQVDKFANVEYESGLGGAPLLLGCAARFQCSVYQKIDAGDHWLFIGKVEAFDDQNKAALCYHKGGYSMLCPHPGTHKVAEDASKNTSSGKLNDNILYLMLGAVQAYQQGYTPLQESLGFNSIASRILMNISDNKTVTANTLASSIFSPEVDINHNLTMLVARNYITFSNDDHYILTEKGAQQAEKYWALVEHYQNDLFNDYSEDEIQVFKRMLATLAKK